MTGMAWLTTTPSSAAAALAARGGCGRNASTKRNASAVLTYFLARRARVSGRIITLLLEPNVTGSERCYGIGIADDGQRVPRGQERQPDDMPGIISGRALVLGTPCHPPAPASLVHL